MTITRFALTGAAITAALALTACGGGSEEVTVANDMTTENLVIPPEDVSNASMELPSVNLSENITAEAPPPPPAEELTADEQTQEDADATGMTARVSRDEDGNHSVRQ